MKFSVRALLLLLIIGAIINILVAVGCSNFIIPRYQGINIYPGSVPRRFIPDKFQQDEYPGEQWQGFGLTESNIYNHGRFNGFSLSMSSLPIVTWQLEDFYQGISINSQSHLTALSLRDKYSSALVGLYNPIVLIVQSGWPLKSLQGAVIQRWDKTSLMYAFRNNRVIKGKTISKVIPLRPLVLPFAFNSFFYAILVWSLMFLGSKFGISMRRLSGLCPHCKYDLRGNLETGCPECGWGREEHPICN